MEPSTDDNRADESRGGILEMGCLLWALWAIGAGPFLSVFSVVYSVHFASSDIFGSCPNGFVAGFPLAFVEFDGGDADANDPPRTLFGMLALGERLGEVCPLGLLLNAFLWILFVLATIVFLRWFLGTVMRGSEEWDEY